MQEHCRAEHQWRNAQKPGGKVREKARHSPNRLWEEGQSCQQFFKAVGWKRLCPVRASGSRNTPPAVCNEHTQRRADRLFGQYQDNVREAKQQRSVEGDSSRFVANAWLSFTGWAGHVSQFINKDQIQAYIQRSESNEDDERGLEDACRGTRRLIRAAFAVSRPGMVSKAALESVNRRETGAETKERPFYAEQQVKTIRKYSDSWVQILRYVWRTASEMERPKYRMTERQTRHLEKLRDATRIDHAISQNGSDRGNRAMAKAALLWH